jgi:hypothetical protein
VSDDKFCNCRLYSITLDESSGSNSSSSLGVLDKAKARPGRYTAPELDQEHLPDFELIGVRKADICAFGCVFSELVAYAVGLQPHLVEEYRCALSEGFKDQRFCDATTKAITPASARFRAKITREVRLDRPATSNVEGIAQSANLVKGDSSQRRGCASCGCGNKR